MQQGFSRFSRPVPPARSKETEEPCTVCRGEGLVKKTKTLSVKVLPGVDTGDRIRLSGEGEAGPRVVPMAICTFKFRLNSTRYLNAMVKPVLRVPY